MGKSWGHLLKLNPENQNAQSPSFALNNQTSKYLIHLRAFLALFTFLLSTLFSPTIQANQCLLYLDVSTSVQVRSPKAGLEALKVEGLALADYGRSSAVERAHTEFEFPEEGLFFTSEKILRIAIHEAFGGRDYYTGEPLDYDQMTIDHVLPKAKARVRKNSSGESDNLWVNNIWNYVPTAGPINVAKGHSFDESHLKVLQEIRDIYAPRVLAYLRLFGAFDNREEDLAKAKIAFLRRSRYRFDHNLLGPNINIQGLKFDRPMVFRRLIDIPNTEVQELLSLFSKELSLLTEDEFNKAINSRYLQFHIDPRYSPSIDGEDQAAKQIYFSYRRPGEKLLKEQTIFQTDLYKITRYGYDRRAHRIIVGIEFHPMFALKMLEAPYGRLRTLKFIHSFFSSADITREEFSDWTQ